MHGEKLYKKCRKFLKEVDWGETDKEKQRELLEEGVTLLGLLMVDVAESLKHSSEFE